MTIARNGLSSTLAAVLATSLLTAGCHGIRPPAPQPPRVAKVEDLGVFTTNAMAYGRDAGNSVRMGEDVLWVFGDTFTWVGMESSTAAWSSVEKPTELVEPVDPWFASFPFYQMSATEQEFNDTRDPSPCCAEVEDCQQDRMYCHCPLETDCTTRIALWPGDLIDIDGTQALNYYEKVLVGSAPYDFEHLGTGMAIVEHGATTAIRPVGADGLPRLLFGSGEPNFLRATAATEDGHRFIYLYASTNRRECEVDILAARVRIWQAFDRSAYRFWNGGGWSASLAEARPILDSIDSGLGSVSWNDHLGGYLSAFNDICSGGTELWLRTAPRPEGPWSEVTAIDLAPLGATSDAYAGQIHSSLGSGRDLIFTFYQPQELGVGRIRVGRLRLE